jgi:transposase-like protein
MVAMDKSSSNKSAIDSISAIQNASVRQVKYLNNIIEQDRSFIKKLRNQC